MGLFIMNRLKAETGKCFLIRWCFFIGERFFRHLNHGYINMNFDVIGGCYNPLKNCKLDIVGGGSGVTEYQLDQVCLLE